MHCQYAVIRSAFKLWGASVCTFRKMENSFSTSALQRSHHCCHQGKTDDPPNGVFMTSPGQTWSIGIGSEPGRQTHDRLIMPDAKTFTLHEHKIYLTYCSPDIGYTQLWFNNESPNNRIQSLLNCLFFTGGAILYSLMDAISPSGERFRWSFHAATVGVK